MRVIRTSKSSNSNKLVFLGTQAFLCRHLNPCAAFSTASIGSTTAAAHTNHFSNAVPNCSLIQSSSPRNRLATSESSSRLFSSMGTSMSGPSLTNVDKQQMEEIIEDYEQGGREESGYVVMDVREENEVAMSGKVSPNTHTLPLSIVGSKGVFELDEDDFERICGFPKPSPDETLVFTCAAGVRSKNACAYAAQAGYTKLVNYMGGAYEWFAN